MIFNVRVGVKYFSVKKISCWLGVIFIYFFIIVIGVIVGNFL